MHSPLCLLEADFCCTALRFLQIYNFFPPPELAVSTHTQYTLRLFTSCCSVRFRPLLPLLLLVTASSSPYLSALSISN
jgi:hypothetical protein